MVVRFTFFLLISFCSFTFSQIAVTNALPFNTEESVINVLVDNELEISNFSSVGFAQGIGYFDGFNSNIGFAEGVILSTGGIEFVTGGFGGGSGISGDSDLELALNAINLTWGVNNVTVLEFDFVAGDESVAFNYVFGSSEYENYTCSQYNDIFGFFLSGPGITGPYSNNAVNLAYIPDPDNPGEYTTTPVAVNTVNSGSASGSFDPQTCADIDPNWVDYSVYWIDNITMPSVSGINGFTEPFTAEYNGLQCGETYHIKLAIADASDGALNSVVFLEAGSFSSPEVQIIPDPNIDGPELFGDDLAVYEGCSPTVLEFLSDNDEYDVLLELSFSGAAEYGDDFEITYVDGSSLDPCPDSVNPCINIPAGQEQLYLNIQAFYDEDPEFISPEFPYEDLQITITTVAAVCQQANLTLSEINFNLYDQIELLVDGGSEEILCFGDDVTIEPNIPSGGYVAEDSDYIYEWYDEMGTQIGSDLSVNVAPTVASEYTLVVYDDCGDQTAESFFSIEVAEYEDITIEYVLDPELPCYGEEVEILVNPSGGSLDYSYIWEDDSEDVNSYNYIFEEGDEEQEVFLEIFDNCSAQLYDFVIPINLIDHTDITNDSNPDPVCYGDEVLIEANPSGGSGDYLYLWPESSEACNCDSYDEYIFDEDGGAQQTVTFWIIDNCTNESFEQEVEINLDMFSPEPDVDISPLSSQVCPGDEIELMVEADGESTYTYEWIEFDINDDDFQSISNSDIIPVSPDSDTTYWVLIRDDCNHVIHGPYDYTVDMPIYDSPTFELDDYSACEGDQVTITVQNKVSDVDQEDDEYDYLWSNGATGPTITVTVQESPTQYTLTLYDKCGNPGTENIYGDVPIAEVTASIPPAPEFIFDQDGGDVQFEQLTDGVFVDFEWDFDNDGSIDSEAFEPSHTYEEEGDYTVVLTAYDDLGCKNKYNAIINVYASLFFYAPNIFTPNGDGINESFNVSVTGHAQDDFELFIFDRWGKQLFYTQDPSDGWDGKYPNGNEVPQDVYMYKAKIIKEGTEDKTLKKGKIAIVK